VVGAISSEVSSFFPSFFLRFLVIGACIYGIETEGQTDRLGAIRNAAFKTEHNIIIGDATFCRPAGRIYKLAVVSSRNSGVLHCWL